MRAYLCVALWMSIILLTKWQIAAQIPLGIQYQAVLRNDQGGTLGNRQINMRATILRSATQSILYRETNLLVTNEFGLINAVIGQGNPLTGQFKDVPWETGGLRLRIEIDPDGGNFFRPFGETDLQSVPYAFAAETALNVEPSARINTSQINGGGALQGQILRWNGSQWAPSNESGGSAINVSPRLSGNGTQGAPLDLARQGAEVGQVLKWNGASWTPANDVGIAYVEGTGIMISGNQINARNTQAIWNASQLRGRPVLDIAPSPNQFMVWDGFNWAPTTVQTGLILPYEGSHASSSLPAFRVTNPDGAGINGRGLVGVRATFSGAGSGTALEIQSGGIRVTGGNRPAFQVNGTGNIVINNANANNNPLAMLQVTQVIPNPGATPGPFPFSVSYDFLEGRWYIISDPNVTLSYNVLVINQ